jgi:hypothetical protein
VVSSCANPSCDARFKYLREGRLFQFQAATSAGRAAAGNPVELWWLCQRCCLSMTLVGDSAHRVKLVPLARAPGRQRTGSD